MKRIYSDYAYGAGPRDGCWWDETIAAPDWPNLTGDLSVDVAIVGAGFTGVSAALHLAEAGATVAVLDAETPGWGASGRNGGFCCLGGGMAANKALIRRFGQHAAQDYWRAEHDAVAMVAALLDRFQIDADTHSNGETQLAHRPKDMENLRKTADEMARAGGPDPVLIEREDLAAQGMGGPFFGALTNPVGFGLNPRKYLFGLADAARQAGAQFYQRSPVSNITRNGPVFSMRSGPGSVTADQVLIATNGYSSEDVPDWLAARYMPSQSNVLVTRPMDIAELDAQEWTSDQAAYDTRGLLHYFRLMPDRRFLFGMRGGLLTTPKSEADTRRRTRRDFEKMFPAWSHVDSTNSWSGMVCLARDRMPFVGPVPNQPGMFAALAFHGNGVAMGSYSGRLLAGLAMGQSDVPMAMQSPLRRFPLGRARRLLMPPIYLGRALKDI